jgi:hypothetical protein
MMMLIMIYANFEIFGCLAAKNFKRNLSQGEQLVYSISIGRSSEKLNLSTNRKK